jgi:hypothetical protein
MKNKTGTYISIIFLIVIAVYGGYYMIIEERLMRETGKYTIGVIKKTKIGSKGIRVFITYNYKEKGQEVDYITEYSDRSKLQTGKRVFIKFIPESGFKYIKLDLDCIVPDSIKKSPLNGWSEQWMKENFPDYLELINKS